MEKLSQQKQVSSAYSEQQALVEGDVLEVEAKAIPQNTTAEALTLLSDSLVSYLPGRARLRHESLKRARDLLPLKSALLEAGFQDVNFTKITGSVLLTWNESQWDQAGFLVAALPLADYLLRAR